MWTWARGEITRDGWQPIKGWCYVYIDDTSALKGGEYGLKYDGSDYVAFKPDGKTVKSRYPIQRGQCRFLFLDGMRVEVRNPLELGEKLLLRPTRNFAAQIQMETKDPRDIAKPHKVMRHRPRSLKRSAGFAILAAGQLREFEVIVSPKGEQFAVTDLAPKAIF